MYKVTFDTKALNKLTTKQVIPEMYDIGLEIQNFVKERFLQGNWLDTTPEPWKPVEGKTRTLIESGNLWNSIRIMGITKWSVETGSDLPYADIHNEGGTIKVTEKQRKYFWRKYSETKNLMWKHLALTDKITIPKRQFIGESKELVNRIMNLTDKKIKE